MKKYIVFTILTLCSGAALAQSQSSKPGTAAAHAAQSRKTAIGGMITDGRRHPIPGVEAFIYQADSTIIASGNTDSAGMYETNSVMPGKYDLKLVYPNNKYLVVKAVVVKNGVTPVSFQVDQPAADTTVQYAQIAPKPEAKKKAKKP